jgi:peptidoglycan/LPS O-acetylase OafA/YrhL
MKQWLNTDTSKAHSPKYRPDVDGLRALAVLAVILFHAGLGCTGGFVGVDIFFVISGFLITSLILKELGDDTFSLTNFWERRIRRILPALMAVVIATIVAGWFLYLPRDYTNIGKSVIGQATLISNVIFSQDTDYFAAGSDTKPLLHTWSLAVEEQFYLLFPFLLVLLVRYRRLSLSKIIVCIAAGSFMLSVVGTYSDPETTFYLLPMRAWELMTGIWLATTRGTQFVGELVRETAGWLGIGLVCCSIFFYDRDTLFPGLAAIPPCLGAALIIFSSESKLSGVGRILAFKPVVFIGLISYSLYLWHWPLLVFSKYQAREVQSAGFRASLLAASIMLSIFSWKFIETPIRKNWILRERRQIFGFAGISMAALLGLGLLIFYGNGFPSRFSAKVLYYADSWNHRAFLNVISLDQAKAGQFVELGSQDTNKPVSVLIWGDSHAMALTPVLDGLCRQHLMRGIQATQISTAPVLGFVSPGAYSLKEKSPAFAEAVLAFISQRHVRNVIIAARWAGYPASDSLKTNLLSTVRAIMDLGARVYVVKDVPNPGFDVPRIVALTAAHHGDLDQLGITREKYDMSNRDLLQTFDQISKMGATVLDPSDYFLNRNGLYGVVQNDQVLYCDSHHLTVEGSRLLAPMFEPVFHGE